MNKLLPVALLFVTSGLFAQEARTDKILFASDATARALDWYTTDRFMNAPCKCFHERDPIAPKTPTLVPVFQIGMTLAVGAGAIYLTRRGHRKLARTLLILDIADESVGVINNININPRSTNVSVH